jgi:hypothetical protein
MKLGKIVMGGVFALLMTAIPVGANTVNCLWSRAKKTMRQIAWIDSKARLL